ncbi:hypothetical protein V2J09_017402 [Rumex salicifolius]
MADFISHKLLDFHSINPAGASLPFHVSPYLSLYTVCLSPPKRRSSSPISCNHSSHPNSNSTPPIAIISTTEYLDGGFLFRFGDPSEIVEDVNDDSDLVLDAVESSDDVFLEPNPVAVETVHEAEMPVMLSDSNEQDFETVFVGVEENGASTSVLENVTDFQEESDSEEVDGSKTSPEFDDVVDTATSSPLEEEAPGVINDDDDDDSVYPEVSLEIELPNVGCGTDELIEIAENSLNADSLDSLVHVDDSVTDDYEVELMPKNARLEADLAHEEEIGEDFPGDDLLSAEREEISSPTLVLASGVASLTRPSQVLTGVEDAYFVSDEKWFIVANSVGEWSFEGMKPGLYGREFVKNFQSLTSNSDGCKANVREVLRQSAPTKQSSGVASALIAHFNNEVLQVANIGDTGFIILRNGFVHESSSPVMHEFYLPVQIGSSDDPLQVVEEHQVHLEDGDAIIIATDGLFDNLYDEDIASIVSKSLQDNMNPKELAELLAKRAQEVGSSLSARCPFADKAKAAGYTGFTGGKLDHVTVIVSLVKKQLCPQ